MFLVRAPFLAGRAEADVYLNPILEGTAIAKGPEQGCLLGNALSLSKTTREARLSSQGCLATREAGKRSSPRVSDFQTPTDARRVKRRHVKNPPAMWETWV